MEYEKYYDKRANGYVVHFPNNKELSLQEIIEVFSAFGKIVSVNNRGKSNGLCFVRYETVEDAKKCIDGFRNNSSIKILPHKIKNNNIKPLIDINTNIEASKDVDTDAQRKSEDKKIFKQNTFKNNSGENNHFTDCNLSESSSKDNFDDVEDNDDVDVDGKNKTNHHSPQPILSLKQRIRNLKKFASNTSISSAATNNTSRELEDILDETNIPALVHIDQKYGTHNINNTPSSAKIVPAHEVIVANIHSSLTIHYILHLFEKFNPISISLMMRLPKTNILYCHVYFKTYEEAYAIMKQFDMHNVHGKKLIVLTSNKLMKEISQI
ncbi:hypothetical protein K0M31_016775 [Melipona bicolor]|uniref:RRM domain-containing protein n=1 Tax=Melipona bicolor TaxID=60889 RepID=A0AA40FE85_9HYME|nr:hypothetical protein K0M31_016775 [Melipona bicolor]